MAMDSKNSPDRNPDLITDAPGSHPGGTAIGSASGAATGAALGLIGGPIGAIIGGIAGAIVGGGVGHEVGEWNDPTEDEAYWKEQHTDRPYVKQGENYDNYAGAYRYGGHSARALNGSNQGGTAVAFEESENDIRAGWEKNRKPTDPDYSKVRGAIKDAYDRSIQLREERLNVGKERVQTGEASVRKEVTTEHRTVDVPLQREELVIERHAVSGTSAKGSIGDGETIRIPLSEERATVGKETFVTEEVNIGKKSTTENKTVEGDVRKETLKVDNATKPKM